MIYVFQKLGLDNVFMKILEVCFREFPKIVKVSSLALLVPPLGRPLQIFVAPKATDHARAWCFSNWNVINTRSKSIIAFHLVFMAVVLQKHNAR